MKLVLAISIALAMASPALAFNLEWHGDLNNRASYSTQADTSTRISSDSAVYYSIDGQDNITVPAGVDFEKNSKDAGLFAELKYRLHMVASDDEQKVKGVLGLEFGSNKYGDAKTGLGGDNRDTLELRWAYTDIELPFDSASRLSVGLQPVGYNAFVWSDNAAGVKWSRKTGHFAYSLGWWRTDWVPTNGAAGADDNQNGELYAADVTYVADNGNALNGFVIFRDQGEDTTFGATSTTVGVDDDLDGLADRFVTTTTGGTTVTRDSEIWLGLSGKGSWGNLSAMATGVYLTGEVKTDSVTDELDRSAYLLHAQADYKMDKFTFTLGGLYASGDDDPNDDDLENFDHIDISTSVLGSVVIFDNFADDNSPSQAFYVFDQGYKIIYLGAKYALNDKTDVWGKYFWHNTAEDNLLGDDEIGHEFVVGASYKIMKGVTAAINAGYLVAGDALDTLSGGLADDADDIFRTDAKLQFKF